MKYIILFPYKKFFNASLFNTLIVVIINFININSNKNKIYVYYYYIIKVVFNNNAIYCMKYIFIFFFTVNPIFFFFLSAFFNSFETRNTLLHIYIIIYYACGKQIIYPNGEEVRVVRIIFFYSTTVCTMYMCVLTSTTNMLSRPHFMRK